MDGFPVAPVIRRWKTGAISIVEALFWPFQSIYERYSPPLRMQVEQAAGNMSSVERSELIDTLETERHSLSNSMASLVTTLKSIEKREEKMEQYLSELEELRLEAEINLDKTSESLARRGAAADSGRWEALRVEVQETIPTMAAQAHRQV